MRGRRDQQTTMLAFVDLEERVPRKHPLRAVKQFADRALRELSPVFDQMYAAGGRPSLRLNPSTNQLEYVNYPEDNSYRMEPGFALGGPLAKNKAWFYAAHQPLCSTAQPYPALTQFEQHPLFSSLRRVGRDPLATVSRRSICSCLAR